MTEEKLISNFLKSKCDNCSTCKFNDDPSVCRIRLVINTAYNRGRQDTMNEICGWLKEDLRGMVDENHMESRLNLYMSICVRDCRRNKYDGQT